jgi:hypothetical protein
MFVFLFLEGGVHPRAIARIEWEGSSPLFVKFPELPSQALDESVEANIRAFSRQYGASVFTWETPGGCTPDELMRWIGLHRGFTTSEGVLN